MTYDLLLLPQWDVNSVGENLTRYRADAWKNRKSDHTSRKT